MKHKSSNRILSRSSQHRRQLLLHLTSSLLEHTSIITTEAKAKELRRHLEPLITNAKKGLSLANRRYLLGQLAKQQDLDNLIAVAEKAAHRPGGYMRLSKIHSNRSDQALMVKVEILS